MDTYKENNSENLKAQNRLRMPDNGKWIIPNIVIVGYGRTQLYQYECLKCKDLFFPEYEKIAFCDTCYTHSLNLSKFPTSETKGIFNILRWEQKSTGSNKRTRYNYTKIYKRDRFTCQYCGYKPVIGNLLPLHIDHIHPFSKNGSNRMDNLVVSCQDCNQMVSAKSFSNFIYKKWFIQDLRKERKLPIYNTELNPFPELLKEMGIA